MSIAAQLCREYLGKKLPAQIEVTPDEFGQYLSELQESQRKEALLPDGRALWYGMGKGIALIARETTKA